MTRLDFDLHAVGVLAPGLPNLAALRAARRSGTPPDPSAALSLPAPSLLPAAERRRASPVVRLALACIEQALATSPFAATALRSVFATDEGTGEVSQHMLQALATPPREVSPLLFTHSVHNAPAGCFSIAWGNRQPSCVASLGLDSFACGLLCAVSEAHTSGAPVLLVAYDPALPAPLAELLAIGEPTASAWVIAAPGSTAPPAALGRFSVEIEAGEASATPFPAWLPARWAAHSSAHGLAALGLLDAAPGTVCRVSFGSQVLSLRCLEPGAP